MKTVPSVMCILYINTIYIYPWVHYTGCSWENGFQKTHGITKTALLKCDVRCFLFQPKPSPLFSVTWPFSPNNDWYTLFSCRISNIFQPFFKQCSILNFTLDAQRVFASNTGVKWRTQRGEISNKNH